MKQNCQATQKKHAPHSTVASSRRSKIAESCKYRCAWRLHHMLQKTIFSPSASGHVRSPSGMLQAGISRHGAGLQYGLRQHLKCFLHDVGMIAGGGANADVCASMISRPGEAEDRAARNTAETLVIISQGGKAADSLPLAAVYSMRYGDAEARLARLWAEALPTRRQAAGLQSEPSSVL